MSTSEDRSTLGEEIRDLRRLRRLSLFQAALRAGMTPGALGNWENGRRSPRGAPLGRLLDALEAPLGLRIRLLALADPGYARIKLEHGALGAPVHVGTILRALRVRAKMTQAALARPIGVAQSTVARWEAGDDVPDAATLHAALHAAGASAEEAAAAARSEGDPPPNDPEERLATLRYVPHAIREPVSLLLERDLWWRATSEPAAEDLLLRAIAGRAAWYEFEDRSDAIAEPAHRALRLACGASKRVLATPAVLALAQARLASGADPGSVARTTGAWAEDLDAPAERAWALSVQALALAAAGDPIALAIARSAVALADRSDSQERLFRQIDLAKTALTLDEPDLALEALGDDYMRFVRDRVAGGYAPCGFATRALAQLALGNEPEPDLLFALRGFVTRTRMPMYVRELRSVERAAAQHRRRA